MNLSDVVDYFVANDGDLVTAEGSTRAGKLYNEDGTMVAIKSGGEFILNSTMNQELSDTLVMAIAKNGAKLRRTNLATLSNSATVAANLENDKLEDFRLSAQIFDFSYTDEELKSIALAKGFVSRAKKFFSDLAAKEAEEKRQRELATMEERQRKATEKWDKGEGDSRNNDVKGAGNSSIRLRLNDKPARPKVQTSQGQSTTTGVVRKAWDFACEYWYGGKLVPHYGYAEKTISNGSYYSSGRVAKVSADKVAIGCQTIAKEEAERFADLMGWPRGVEAAK